MNATTRSSQGLDPRRRALRYRCWHRGTREMDLIMGRFADAVIDELSECELADLERLSEAPDHDLYAWIVGRCEVPASYNSTLFRRLRAFYDGRT